MQDLTQSETSVGPRQPPSARRSALFVFLATTALAVFFAAQNYFAAATMHRAVSWQQATYWSFTDWYEWALVAPIIFWLCRRFTFERRSWPKSLAIYLFAGILLAGVHGVLCAASDVLQGREQFRSEQFPLAQLSVTSSSRRQEALEFCAIATAHPEHVRRLRLRL